MVLELLRILQRGIPWWEGRQPPHHLSNLSLPPSLPSIQSQCTCRPAWRLLAICSHQLEWALLCVLCILPLKSCRLATSQGNAKKKRSHMASTHTSHLSMSIHHCNMPTREIALWVQLRASSVTCLLQLLRIGQLTIVWFDEIITASWKGWPTSPAVLSFNSKMELSTKQTPASDLDLNPFQIYKETPIFHVGLYLTSAFYLVVVHLLPSPVVAHCPLS